MYTRWTSHLKNEKDVTSFKYAVSGAKPVLERIRDLLEDELRLSKSSSQGKESYENPSWAYLQADAIGEQRAYSKMLKLINNAIEG